MRAEDFCAETHLRKECLGITLAAPWTSMQLCRRATSFFTHHYRTAFMKGKAALKLWGTAAIINLLAAVKAGAAVLQFF